MTYSFRHCLIVSSGIALYDATNHVYDLYSTVREGDGVWRAGHRKHEGEGAGHRYWGRQIERVHPSTLRLSENIEKYFSIRC